MSGLDHSIAGLGHGGGAVVALLIALLLGLRHATDPDHLTAVSALALSDEERGARRAGLLGLTWGLGHATTLLLFGVPALLLRSYLPAAAQHLAEAVIGAVIVGLALRLLHRWRHGYFHSHPHRHGERWHTHPHAHTGHGEHTTDHSHGHEEGLGRSPLAAYGIGLVHGIGGSAAVTLLLISAIPQRLEATAALIIFALATAASMYLLSLGFGTVIASRLLARRLESAVPVLGLFSLGFGVFYALAAASLA
jgi:ABC-type nickel/cobalt efflux system permease component RcnA